MSTKQDFVNFIQTELPNAYDSIGSDKLAQWASGQIFSVTYDRWFDMFQIEGSTQRMKNLILHFCNLPSVGYDDFTDHKKKMGDLYRTYLAMAQRAVANQQSIVNMLQSNLQTATDPHQKIIISTQLSTEQSRLKTEQANALTWQTTIDKALKAGQIV